MAKYCMFTSMQDRLERAGHCQTCEWYARSMKQCRQCGCLVNLKVTIAAEECPIGKWKAVNPGSDFISQVSSKIQNFLKPKK